MKSASSIEVIATSSMCCLGGAGRLGGPGRVYVLSRNQPITQCCLPREHFVVPIISQKRYFSLCLSLLRRRPRQEDCVLYFFLRLFWCFLMRCFLGCSGSMASFCCLLRCIFWVLLLETLPPKNNTRTASGVRSLSLSKVKRFELIRFVANGVRCLYFNEANP